MICSTSSWPRRAAWSNRGDALSGFAVPGLEKGQLGVDHDGRKNVVEVVGDAAGQGPQGLDLLGPAEEVVPFLDLGGPLPHELFSSSADRRRISSEAFCSVMSWMTPVMIPGPPPESRFSSPTSAQTIRREPSGRTILNSMGGRDPRATPAWMTAPTCSRSPGWINLSTKLRRGPFEFLPADPEDAQHLVGRVDQPFLDLPGPAPDMGQLLGLLEGGLALGQDLPLFLEMLDHLLGGFELGEVHPDQAYRGSVGPVEQVGPGMDGYGAAARLQDDPRLRRSAPGLGQQQVQTPTAVATDELRQGSSRDVLQGLLDHLGETVVGEEDGPLGRDGQADLGHRLDHQPVEALGLAEREDPLALAAGDDDGVDLAFADGPEGVLGLGQSAPQALELAGPLRSGTCPAARSAAGPAWRGRTAFWSFLGSQIEADQNALRIGHVPDHPSQRQRQLLDQGGGGDDLLAPGQGRLAVDIDDIQDHSGL